MILFFELGGFLLEEASESNVRVDDIRNSLGWVESSNLDNVVPVWPLELVHLLFETKVAELSHVEGRVPWSKFFVETIKPIGQESEHILRGARKDSLTSL